VPGRAAFPTSSLSALRASVSTLLISSRGADGVKRKPGHWFPFLKISDSQSRTRFSFPAPPVVCGWRIGRGRLPILSNEDQLFDKLNIEFTNGWSADCVRHTTCLSGSCLHEVMWSGLAVTSMSICTDHRKEAHCLAEDRRANSCAMAEVGRLVILATWR
jgi:hypothetical protein